MRLWRGLDIDVGGRPRQEVEAVEAPPWMGLLGSDYPGLRLKATVAPGDKIAAGDPVMADRADPSIRVTTPVAGTVEEVAIGPKRRIAALILRPTEAPPRRFASAEGATASREAAQALLLDAGLWTALLARPFGRIPRPGTAPAALFVAALDTEPGAADPAPIVRSEAEAFRRGLACLEALTDGPVFLCQAPGAPLAPASARLRIAEYAGPHPAGLPGTHIDRLMPSRPDREVWQIGAQEVLALGRLLATGTLDGTRTVALCGPQARDPRLLRLPIGADIEALAAREARLGPRKVLSGSALSGSESRFLRRRHVQITLLPRPAPAPLRSWLPNAPSKRPPLVPHAALERALGPRLPVMPLLRALSLGDDAEAARLGAAGLLEEDLALASYLSGGTEDFGARLRDILDRLAGEAA